MIHVDDDDDDGGGGGGDEVGDGNKMVGVTSLLLTLENDEVWELGLELEGELRESFPLSYI